MSSEICIGVLIGAIIALFGFVVGTLVGVGLDERAKKTRARIIGGAGRMRVTRIRDGDGSRISQRRVPGGV